MIKSSLRIEPDKIAKAIILVHFFGRGCDQINNELVKTLFRQSVEMCLRHSKSG